MKKTLWEFYNTVPPFAYFSFSVIEKISNTEFETLSFSKNVSEDERRSGEERLDDLIESICYTTRFGPVSGITCDCIYGLLLNFFISGALMGLIMIYIVFWLLYLIFPDMAKSIVAILFSIFILKVCNE